MVRIQPVEEIASARAMLRRVTHDSHERLHAHPAFKQLLDEEITLDTYRQLLVRLYQFHWPLEDSLAGRWSRDVGLDLEPRRRVRLLLDDLLAIGVDPFDITAIAQAPIPPLLSKGHLLGCLYVREGATLGGKVLASRLDRLFGGGARGRSFFRGTRGDGALWNECCHAFELAADEGHLPEMIKGACATFAAFEAWFDRFATPGPRCTP